MGENRSGRRFGQGDLIPVRASARYVMAFCASLVPCGLAAQDIFEIRGDRLIVGVEPAADNYIEEHHAPMFLDLLRETNGLRVIELNSGGGSLWAAQRMSDAIVDYGLDTHVNGECASSCALVFLGGTTRTMSLGSRIGFHQNWWAAPDIESYYRESAEQEGWDTPFEFGAWIYTDTQREIYDQLIYMVRRGVDPLFAIETLKAPPDGMWYPYRIRLIGAGVLTQ